MDFHSLKLFRLLETFFPLLIGEEEAIILDFLFLLGDGSIIHVKLQVIVDLQMHLVGFSLDHALFNVFNLRNVG